MAGKDPFFDIDLLEIAKQSSMTADKCNNLGLDLYNKGKLDEMFHGNVWYNVMIIAVEINLNV